jgi:hypothetical protein
MITRSASGFEIMKMCSPCTTGRFTSEQTVAHAHNDYLQMLIEAGWIGFAALSGFFIFIGKSARRIRQLDVQRIRCGFPGRGCLQRIDFNDVFTVFLILTCRSLPIASILLF